MLIGRFQQRLPKAMFATALFAFLSFGGSSAFAAPQSVSSDKELSAALKNVKTADDHRHIAAYYQQKAQKLQDKEKQEQQLADYFAAHPSMYGKQYPTPYQNHKGLSDYYHRAATEALKKATQHQEAAESLTTTSH